MGKITAVMDGIDIASHQRDIAVKDVPADFVIVKASQGSWYVNPYFQKKYAQAKAAGRLVGIYHYSEGTSVEKEVAFFLQTIGTRVGEALLFLDWEGQSNSMFGKDDVYYCLKFMDLVFEMTGVKMLLYVSKSVLRSRNWKQVIEKGYKIWPAQYRNDATTGYQKAAWTDDKGWGGFAGPTIYQYSSHGRLSGYSGNLDINLATITPAGWEELAAPHSIDKQAEALEAQKEEPRNIVVYLDPQQMMMTLALAELGYQEKRSASKLDNKHDNAGSGNYTKYARDMHKVYPKTMDPNPIPWCDVWYDWLCYILFGTATAQSIIMGHFDDYTVSSALLYKDHGAWYTEDPQPMDQVFFSKNGSIAGIYHTGAYLWTESDGTIVTEEGNTSGSAGVDPDGGQTAIKRYKPGSSGYEKIVGYGRPKWSLAGQISCSIPAPQGLAQGSKGAAVRLWQSIVGATVDGDFGPKTAQSTKNFQKAYGLQETGSVVDVDWAAGLALGMISTGMPEIEEGSGGMSVGFLQAILDATVDGDFGPKTDAAVRAFQKAHSLVVDGCVGKKTWAALLNLLR